jgi:hypothetical protein
MFRDRAEKALTTVGATPLGYLKQHPRYSKVQLAKKLNHGANALGLVMAIYKQAVGEDIVREIAYDLLLRKILSEYPNGWFPKPTIRPIVALGDWVYELNHYAGPQYLEPATELMRELAMRSPPPEGWVPNYPTDERLDKLFEKFWPSHG